MFILLIILLLSLVVFYIVRRRKLAKELESKYSLFLKEADSFLIEFDELFKQYIDEPQKNNIVLKYQTLYSELQKYSGISLKLEDFVKLDEFKKKYKDFPKLVAASNAEIRRRENIERLAPLLNDFFDEFSSLINHYVVETESVQFRDKWKSVYENVTTSDVKVEDREYESFKKFESTYRNSQKQIEESNAEIKRRENIVRLALLVDVFFDEYHFLLSRYVAEEDGEIFYQKWIQLSRDVADCNVKTEDPEYEILKRFEFIFRSFHELLKKANEDFLIQESERYDALLSNIDGKSLDAQQREAVITDEYRTLVLAGAGSGKTLTIAGKVKYLCETKNINPQDVLLISFTKKSAQEMTDRIQGKLGISVEATTFHKLGLDIIKKADGQFPKVFDESNFEKFIHDFFENELVNYPDLVRDLIEYFAYYLELSKSLDEYSSLGEMYEDEKSADLETLRSKYDQEKYVQEEKTKKAQEHVTLKNEKVKSLEEVKIANFLFLNGVNYEYEREYPFNDSDPNKKPYQPDFYLTDYGIYLEHFGISKDYTVPWLSPFEAQKYLDGIAWKREVHKQNNTKLLETYSYYYADGVLFQKLKELLKENGVELKSRDFMDVFNTVYASKTNKYFSEFLKLCCTFIVLFKSNGYTVEKIDYWLDAYEDENRFLQERNIVFLSIVKILLEEYQKYLLANNYIDFSDMINKATEKINAGCDLPSYKYVIVDEYQDVSKARFNLVKAIIDRTNARLFCVGDDWQSIYRFAGSDISLFTDFDKFFGKTKVLKIEKTYRNSQKLIDEASRFILQNPLQLKKDLRSDKKLDYPLVFWGFDNDPRSALQAIINKIILDFGTDSSILLLGRTNYDVEIAKNTNLFREVRKNGTTKLEYILNPAVPIQFLSVHKSKGLEADNVILLNFKNDKLGFPNQIVDDPVLNFVLTNAETYKFAEERRLFYVAITRTKNRTYILTDNKNPSQFFKEFSESTSVFFKSAGRRADASHAKCPICQTGDLLKVMHGESSFVGCSNFPRCRFTYKDATVLLNPKRCPNCGGFLVKRKGYRWYYFVGCTNYPECEYTEKLVWN